jgi:hydroxybutyrate-dimer hydrolase
MPTFIVHGSDDGLIPPAFSSLPYIDAAREAGCAIDYREVPNAQHFDAFLDLLPPDTRFVPLLPHVWDALDRAWARISIRR